MGGPQPELWSTLCLLSLFALQKNAWLTHFCGAKDDVYVSRKPHDSTRSSLLTFHQTCFFASKDDGNVAQTGALRPERTATDAMQTIHAPNESVRFRLA